MQVKTLTFKAGDNEGLQPNEFQGWASTFNSVDLDGDIIEKGAFLGSLGAFLEDGFIAWQHNWTQPIGKPLEAREDDHGLFIKAHISDTSTGKDALILMRDGVVKKMSIGFETQAEALLSEEQAIERLGEEAFREAMKRLPPWREQLRLITQIKLFEVSPVSLPANPQADITGVKASTIHTEREFEKFLREAGFSRKHAEIIVAKGYRAIGQGEPDAGLSSADLLRLQQIRVEAERRLRNPDRCLPSTRNC